MKKFEEFVGKDFFHYVPDSNIHLIKEHGIISPFFMKKKGLNELYNQSLKKYISRAAKYFNKKEDEVDIELIENYLNKIRGKNGTNRIYLLCHKIPNKFDINLDNFLIGKVLLKLKITKEFLNDIIINISYVENNDNKIENKPEKYFKKTISGKPYFAGIPHLCLTTKDGNIPFKYLDIINI
jgi:hypothetical protein